MNKHDWATGKPIKEGPEESVRQDYERVLHFDYGYAKNQMDIEVLIQRGSQSREKADIVVYKTTNRNRRSQNRDILGIIELKRKERKDGVEQLMSYMTATSCSWGVWTNGKEIEYLGKDHTTGEVLKDVIFQIPKRGKELADIGHFRKTDLKPASNLKLIFRRILQHLYTNADNISRREKLGNEVIRLIFCKLYDEQFNVEDIPDFRVSVSDKNNNWG